MFDMRGGGLPSRRPIASRVLLAALALAAAAPVARADLAPVPAADCSTQAQPQHLAADATRPGVISLFFDRAQGRRVLYWECFGDRAVRLGARKSGPLELTVFENATQWSCDRLERHFAAAATMADGSVERGTYSVRTPSCARRFRLDVPAQVAPGAVARVRVIDLWGIGGVSPRLCVTPARAARACQAVALRSAVATRRFRAAALGRWRVGLHFEGAGVRGAFDVGPAVGPPVKAPLQVLATGDSMMQGVDSFLSDELGAGAHVHSDVLPGSQISRGDFWARHAAAQTRRRHQDVTVISTGGASDGLALANRLRVLQPCCSDSWKSIYARRVRKMMRTYLQGGRGDVVWLTLPAPRSAPRKLIDDAVNAAIVHAAQGLPGVTVVRMDLLFTPNGFQETIRCRGRDVAVREPDGVHLNIAGTAIAANAVCKAITDRPRRRGRGAPRCRTVPAPSC